jgi:hypothetical protein
MRPKPSYAAPDSGADANLYPPRPHAATRTAYRVAFTVIYAFALLQFVRYYSKATTFYLHLNAYLTGHERLPFQERVLPILFLKPLYGSPWIMQHFGHSSGAFTMEKGPFYLLSLISLAAAAIYTQRLYAAVTEHNLLSFLVFPAFLYTVMWTYSIHSEANFSYPYDFPGLAFFTAGLYYIYCRKYLPLLLVILIGTFNRETTLFLIGIYCIDAATRAEEHDTRSGGFDLRQIPWVRVATLSVIWVAIKVGVSHAFAGNDRSEDFLRLGYNFDRLTPRLWPAMLNICGYLLPLILIFHRKLEPRRFRNYLWIMPLWFGIMFCTGVLVETRIYGELCSYCAVAAVVMTEALISSVYRAQPEYERSQGLAGAGRLTPLAVEPEAEPVMARLDDQRLAS